MNFLEAVKAMKEGKRITRPNWSGYIYMKNRRVYHRDGEFKNTAINQFEATNWEIVDLDFDKLFQKLATYLIPYCKKEGLNNVADYLKTKEFLIGMTSFKPTGKVEDVTDEEMAQLEAELKKLEEKDINYGSLNEAWANKDMKAIKKTLAKIKTKVRWK